MEQNRDDGRHKVRGTLLGHLLMVGGPRRHRPTGVPGIVVVEGSEGQFEAVAGPDGSYALTLPPGIYEVTATSPKYRINDKPGVGHASSPASVTGGRETVSDVYFNMK